MKTISAEQEIFDAILQGIEYCSMHSYQIRYVVNCDDLSIFHFSPASRLLLSKLKLSDIHHLKYDSFLESIAHDDTKWIREINLSALHFLKNIPAEEQRLYTLSYNFHLKGYGHPILVCHRFTPVLPTNEEKLQWWLGSISLSSYDTPGHIRLNKYGSSSYWKYSSEEKKWISKEGIVLSEREIELIALSAQGLKEEQIAEYLHISRSLVKFRKQELFARLKVKCMSKAVLRAMNYRLL